MIEMTTRKLIANIKKLEARISAIEKKQAERYPHLIERLERLENKQNATMYNIQYPDD